MATDGWAVDFGEEEREVMKSEMMARWEGLKLPYHMRLTEILPLRRGPLWYWNCNCCCWSFSLRILAAAPKWSAEIMRKRCKRTLEDTREAIDDLCK